MNNTDHSVLTPGTISAAHLRHGSEVGRSWLDSLVAVFDENSFTVGCPSPADERNWGFSTGEALFQDYFIDVVCALGERST